MAEEVCPFWVGYLLSSPIRKLWQSPEKILKPYVNQGMRVLDIGCAMGFFSLAMAKMVGRDGKVICVDIQKKMISSLLKRAKRTGVYDRIEARACTRKSLCMEDVREEIDFALAFAVVHEAPDSSRLFSEIYEALKPAGKLLIAEPKGRVSEKGFETFVRTAQGNAFEVVDRLHIRGARAVLMQK